MGKKKVTNDVNTTATRKSKRTKKRSDRDFKKEKLPSITSLRYQRKILESELDQLEQNIFAYETQYLSQGTRGNAVRGYACLLSPQLPKAPDRVHIDNDERIFSKSQH